MNNETNYPQIPLASLDDEDFIVTYDLDGDSIGETYTLHAGEIESFPEPVAIHIKKHYAEKLLFKWGWNGSNPDVKREEIMRQIEVNYNE